MGYQLIETIEVGVGGAASIEFTGIPQDGVDLQILVSGRGTTFDTFQVLKMILNSSDANGSARELYGTGSGASSRSDSYLRTGLSVNASNTANTFGSTKISISNYTSSAFKSISADSVGENNATFSPQSISAMSWSNTAAVTTVNLTMMGGNFAQYSTASLYKITAD